MKCVKCANDANKKDRTDGKCPKCGEPFAFDPSAGAPFSDMAFKSAIDAVSHEGTVKFEAEHIRLELARRAEAGRSRDRRQAAWAFGILGGVLVAAGGVLVAAGGVLAAAGGVLVAAGTVAGLMTAVPGLAFIFLALRAALRPGTPKPAIPRSTFSGLFHTYSQAHGKPAGLIPPPRRVAPSAEVLAELESYSFDRAVVCDTADTAELLIANDFHFENNCAVLSIDGYPKGVFEVVRKMLRQNPKIEVFALHDCTPAGCALATQLRADKAWFHGVGAVYDVALRPAQAQAFRHAWEPAGGALAERDGISADEATWLREWQLPLAAIAPEQLIKRLYRAISKLPEERLAKGDDGSYDPMFIYIAGSSDGGGDSFG